MYGNSYAAWNLLVPKELDKGPERSPALKKQRIQSVTFPRCLALTNTCLPSDTKPPPTPPNLDELAKLFSSIRKPTDITPQHLRLLNVTCSYDLPLSALIPKKYHADEKDENSVFNQRRKEIAVDNQDAFDFIARKRRDIKIGLFYKFFQAAEMIELMLSTVDEKKEEKEPTSPVSSQQRGNSDKVVDLLVGTASQRTSAKFREELLRQFVDPIAWGFNMRIYPPRYPPKLLSQKSLFNVKADLFLHMQPPLPMERKEGIVIGPGLLLQTRHEERYTEMEDVLDVVHEVCGLLYLGQERQKKGMFKKTRFEAVGKDPELGGDDLFMISSVQHHMALTHVYLSDALIKYFRTGKLPSDEYQKANPDWCSIRLGRTKWHSLIEPEGRVEALRVIMAVLGWQNRKE